jgi:hypothetical protein
VSLDVLIIEFDASNVLEEIKDTEDMSLRTIDDVVFFLITARSVARCMVTSDVRNWPVQAFHLKQKSRLSRRDVAYSASSVETSGLENGTSSHIKELFGSGLDNGKYPCRKRSSTVLRR